LSIPLKVNGWRGPDNKIWRENTRVTVKSLTLEVPNGFTFLIRRPEFTWDENGKKTILNLIPPTFYTKEAPQIPWLK